MKGELFWFMLGDILAIAGIRIFLFFYPVNPEINGIPIHHAYFGIIGIILSAILLSYYLRNPKLRAFFSLMFGGSFGAFLDEVNLIIIPGSSYGGFLTYLFDLVGIVIGIVMYLVSIFIKPKK